MLIDVHAHQFPEKYHHALNRAGRSTRPFTPEGELEKRLQMMDEAGVAMQVLSPANNLPYFEREADAVAAARIINDQYAELTHRLPRRFRAFVSLPLPHIEASLREMERGLDQLGFAGVNLGCSILDRSVAEPAFEPLYQEMNRRSAVLFFHPTESGICSPMINDYNFAVAVGTSMEDTVVVLHMIASHIPHRYPDIRMIVPHLGGLIPMLMQRMDNQVPRAHANLPEKPSVTARRFWYDTVSHGSHAALRCAWEAFGADRLVTGSDYPVLLPFESYTRTFSYLHDVGLPSDDLERIVHHNAAELLGL
jgi:predicted TIM-barrel fold metal-dependent hydrolase